MTGARHPIRHAYSRHADGEFTVDDHWPVDGYIDFGERKTDDDDDPPCDKKVFFEFNGCYWHHCEKCQHDDENTTAEMRAARQKRREGDALKYAHLRRLGELVVQRECEFSWSTLSSMMTETTMPRIKHTRESHDALLGAIVRGEVFGFAQARVRFPPCITRKPVDQGFLFPPITRALCPMRPELLSPWARRQWEAAKRPALPARAIVQTFTTDSQLLLSETLAYYVAELGAKVKIHHFIQYRGERAFTPFCERVIGLRKRSKRENNGAMGTTAKLIGNSAYGKTLG